MIFLIPELFEGFPVKAVLLLMLSTTTAIFFGYSSYTFLDRLISQSPAILIDDKGIINNLPGYEMLYIPWSLVEDFEMLRSSGKYFILVKVNNPHLFIENQEDVINKFLMRMNYKYYQTPVCINGTTLVGNQIALFETLWNAYDQYQEKMAS